MTSARMPGPSRASARVLVRAAFGPISRGEPVSTQASSRERSEGRAKPLVTGYNFSEPFS